MNAYRQLPQHCTWSFDFDFPIQEVWPLVTNTDRLNRACGLPEVHYVHEADQDGGSRRFGRLRSRGMTLRWLEHPYEWVKHRYFRVERTYTSGPLRYMDMHWDFEPIAGGQGCRLTQHTAYEATTWLYKILLAWQFAHDVRRSVLRAYTQINAFLAEQALVPFWPASQDPRQGDPGRIREVVTTLLDAGVEAPFAEQVATFLCTAQSPDLVRIRPFVAARRWQHDRLETLQMFLRGTKAGVFALSWDLLCPSCRGAKDRVESLAFVKNGAHCDACNITYGVEFDRSVELSFTVNSTVREIAVGEFCVGGPQNTPHYLVQWRMQPGETRDITLPCSPGLHRVRSLQSRQSWIAEVSPEVGTSQAQLTFHAGSEHEGFITLAAGHLALSITNHEARELTCIIEEVKWLEDACTAAFVTSLQEFRDLFASEVLRPGQEIGVRSLTLLFTDLKGSTSMYRRIGDAMAFALVRNHFDVLIDCVRAHQGGLVKTIGDAVMGSFTRPEHAVQAALDIQRRMAAVNREQPEHEHLQIKIGIHTGPCFVVNLNDRLDYFGTTVNIAARTEGQCEGGDIIITERMMHDPAVAALVKATGYPVTRTVRALKGFEESFELYRIDCTDEGREATRSMPREARTHS